MSGGSAVRQAPAPVVIVAYDPAWQNAFAIIRERLSAALGPLAVAIHHVGSTSVVGLAAKPIVDVDVEIAGAGDLQLTIDRLAAIGYVHDGDGDIPGRERFRQPANLPRHHCYVCVTGGRELVRHLRFRDALRADWSLAEEYARLKRALAAQYGTDRDGYSVAKTFFVEGVLAANLPPI